MSDNDIHYANNPALANLSGFALAAALSENVYRRNDANFQVDLATLGATLVSNLPSITIRNTTLTMNGGYY